MLRALSRYFRKACNYCARPQRASQVIDRAETVLAALEEAQCRAAKSGQDHTEEKKEHLRTAIQQFALAKAQIRIAQRLNCLTGIAGLFAFIGAGGVIWSVLEDRGATITANRAWVGVPEMILEPSSVRSTLELGALIVNVGREPATRGAWHFNIYSAAYIKTGDEIPIPKLEKNGACNAVSMAPEGEGIAVFPGTDIKSFIPYLTTHAEQATVANALAEKQSLIADGCFAYFAGGTEHKTGFRFFLRDNPSSEPEEWKFNMLTSGNFAD